MHPGGLRLTQRAAVLAGVSCAMHVADIGCGCGASLSFLAEEYGVTGVGIDVSADMIGRARQGGAPGIDFVCCDAACYPYNEGCYDRVFCDCALSEITKPGQVLLKIRDSLRPGGKLILSDVYAKEKKTPGSQRVRAACPGACVSVRAWTKGQLIGLVTGAGFRTIVEEDHTPALVTYAAERFAAGCSGWGYVLIIAEKDCSGGKVVVGGDAVGGGDAVVGGEEVGGCKVVVGGDAVV